MVHINAAVAGLVGAF
ncbi:hypothetical protein ACU4HD_47100 [Cupriavidus basilensis]